MKYRASTEGTEIIKKDYRKKIIFSLDDFDEKGHLLQMVTIPPDTRQRRHSHDRQTEVFFILEGRQYLPSTKLIILPKLGMHLRAGEARFAGRCSQSME